MCMTHNKHLNPVIFNIQKYVINICLERKVNCLRVVIKTSCCCVYFRSERITMYETCWVGRRRRDVNEWNVQNQCNLQCRMSSIINVWIKISLTLFGKYIYYWSTDGAYAWENVDLQNCWKGSCNIIWFGSKW